MTPDDIRSALDRTFAGQSVRVDFEVHPKPLHREGRARRRGGILRPLMRAGGAVANRALESIARRGAHGRGVVDLDGRHCVIAYNGYGEIIHGERSWHGAAGGDINAVDEHRYGDLHPLLALELLRVPSSVDRVSTLRRLPVYVRLDSDGHITAIRHELDFGSVTLRVVQRGVPAPDWTRIPGAL